MIQRGHPLPNPKMPHWVPLETMDQRIIERRVDDELLKQRVINWLLNITSAHGCKLHTFCLSGQKTQESCQKCPQHTSTIRTGHVKIYRAKVGRANSKQPPQVSVKDPHIKGQKMVQMQEKIKEPVGGYMTIYNNCVSLFLITLFRSIMILCGIDNILKNIPHIQFECEKYFAKYFQFHRTLLWI